MDAFKFVIALFGGVFGAVVFYVACSYNRRTRFVEEDESDHLVATVSALIGGVISAAFMWALGVNSYFP